MPDSARFLKLDASERAPFYIQKRQSYFHSAGVRQQAVWGLATDANAYLC